MGYVAKHRAAEVPLLVKAWRLLMAIYTTAVAAIFYRPIEAVLTYLTA
jgi:hypothetical protein